MNRILLKQKWKPGIMEILLQPEELILQVTMNSPSFQEQVDAELARELQNKLNSE